MSEVGPRPKRPLNAKPRTAAQQSQAASVEIRILDAGQDAGTSLSVAGAPGLPALPSAGQARNGRRPWRGRPKPKRPLNAKPRTAARQGQGTAARSASSGAGQDAEASPQAAGRQDDRTTALLLAGQPRNGRHPCKRSAKCQRGSLTQSLASPRGKARGQRQVPHPPAGAKTRKRRCKRPGARTTGVLSAGQPWNERHPCQRSAQVQGGLLTQSPASAPG